MSVGFGFQVAFDSNACVTLMLLVTSLDDGEVQICMYGHFSTSMSANADGPCDTA